MAKDLSLQTYPKNYVVLDIETTGLSPQTNEIIELSAIKVIDGEIKEQFSKLIKPKSYVNSHVSSLTGITNEMLQDAPQIEKVLVEFKHFCSDSIVLGHNINFDISFINAKLKECYNESFNNDYVDTLQIARKLLPQLPSKKLGQIAKYFKLNTDGMHRGLKDCIVTHHCYQRLIALNFEQKKLIAH